MALAGWSLVGHPGQGLRHSERTLPDGEKISLFGAKSGSPLRLVILLTTVQFQRLTGLMTRHMRMARGLLYIMDDQSGRPDKLLRSQQLDESRVGQKSLASRIPSRGSSGTREVRWDRKGSRTRSVICRLSVLRNGLTDSEPIVFDGLIGHTARAKPR
jgi:hypothetical protein